jgi:hypothetical protein
VVKPSSYQVVARDFVVWQPAQHKLAKNRDYQAKEDMQDEADKAIAETPVAKQRINQTIRALQKSPLYFGRLSISPPGAMY